MIGLKRETVLLCNHQKEWEAAAANTITKLKDIFGDAAEDIQHVGSTAIPSIKAKPMLDIAVGVKSLDNLDDIFIILENNGVYKSSKQPIEGDITCAIKDTRESDIVLCNVHIEIFGSKQWKDHINFRDYLTGFSSKAVIYESLKIELAQKHPNNRDAYLQGKNNFIQNMILEANVYIEFKEKFNLMSVEPITKGWSGDKKYCITTADGTKNLLRISPMEQYDRKKSEFEMMKRVATLGVPMCQPIEFGTCDEGVYSLQSWIDGKDAEDVIPTLSDTEKHAYGLESGRILKKIHSISAPTILEDWETRFNRKIDRKIQMYNDCPIKYDNGQVFIDYINANRHLLKNRQQCYQHGDYHIGNMMIDQSGKLQIIDFDRYDFGDPWEEFNRIVWCAQKTPLFASGMVNGYFNGDVPFEFWQLLALYISSNTLSSVPWAVPFGQTEVDTMLNQAKEVLSWYDNMKNLVPTWYKRSSQICYCGHDCSRCLTYLATIKNDNELRRKSQQFYKDKFNLDIPLEKLHRLGGRSEDVFYLCKGCPWMKCAKEKHLSACSECAEYLCKPLAEYQEKYVNKCNQEELNDYIYQQQTDIRKSNR